MNSFRATTLLTSLAVLASFSLTGCGARSTNYPPNFANPISTMPNTFNPDNLNNVLTPNTGLGAVVGKVVDSTGKGLPNVLVNIGSISTTTNLTGDFQLNNIPAGQKSLLLRYGNRELSVSVNVVADTATTPDLNPIQFANNGTGSSGSANTQIKTFLVDQDFFNQWQAKTVAVTGGTIYVGVTDAKGLFKKGSIVRMDSEMGKSWTNIGSKWLGLRFPIDKTVRGIATNGSTLVAVGEKGNLYTVDSNKKIVTASSGPGTDVAVGAGAIYIANGSGVEKSDSSGQTRSLIPNFAISGGICTDSKGNLYGVGGNTVKKLDLGSEEPVEIITQGISNAIDVAVDDKNGFIYVLEASEIKRFTIDGVLQSNFGNGATKALSITTDESGNVYVADEGKDYKTSRIIKFAPGNGNIVGYQNQDSVKAQSSQFDGVGTEETVTEDGATTED
jgi:hypothetical protein